MATNLDTVEYFGFGNITKAQRNADGTVTFEASKATGPDLDHDGQILDPDWAKGAMADWFRTGANLREQHQAIAAGKGLTLESRPDGEYVSGVVVDPVSAMKVDKGVLTGLSVGIKAPRIIKDAEAPNGRVVGGRVVELSLVDRPCNSTCKIVMAKADGAGDMQLVEELVEDQLGKADGPTDKGTMADGSYPINNADQLKAAVHLVGRSKEHSEAEVKAHIIKRAKALGLTGSLPDSWKAEAVELEKTVTPDVEKADDTLSPGERAQVQKMIDDALAKYAKEDAKQDRQMMSGKDDEPDLTKTETADDTKTETVESPDVIGKLDGLTKTITDQNDALTKALESLSERLAKVEAQPAGGGPVVTAIPTATPPTDLRKADLLRQADQYEAAGQSTLAEGCRERAAALV
jgi:hypothetical protein